MYSQFLGNFILNNRLVTPEQLAFALEVKSTIRMKLGVMAINARYMTAKQVEEVHKKQSTVDKRFGDIAIELGYMTNKQVDDLLSMQKTGSLLLGQALIDTGALTTQQFEDALYEYQQLYHIPNDDMMSEKHDVINSIVSEFYHFGDHNTAKLLTNYISILYKNIIRFIGDDFIPLDATVISNFHCRILNGQDIKGEYNIFTGIEGSVSATHQFASRYAEEEIDEELEYSNAVVGEFLNLTNGLFSVNMSNDQNIELDLQPQFNSENQILCIQASTFCIPVKFTFGTINFILATYDDPKI